VLVKTKIDMPAVRQLITKLKPLEDFGLRKSQGFWAWIFGGLVVFWFGNLIYMWAVDPLGKQNISEDLGISTGWQSLFVVSISIIIIAPWVEEIFFRGFLFGALRKRFGFISSALATSVVFASLHFTGIQILDLLPLFAWLGVIFCYLYEKTGSLYVPISLHTINNAMALSFTFPAQALWLWGCAGFSLLICRWLALHRFTRVRC
jgi:membrane protease YdiL (CAAX protease family)